MSFWKSVISISALSLIILVFPAVAATPIGTDTFQLLASPFTGGDNTGDGGTGLPADLNYYYVGQSFNTQFQISSGGTTASNIWVDYDSGDVTASNLANGSFFNTWSGQSINPTATGPTGGRVYSTGAQIPVVTQSGTGSFGSARWLMNQPTAAAYGLGSPEQLDINIGVVGATTESNISLSGVDVLDDEEDFDFHIWADTRAPFAENPNPVDTAMGVSVDQNYTFDLRDTLNGEGDNSGVGTGVSTSTPPGAITFDDGGGAVSYTAYDAYSCSGVWGTNLCLTTINPPSPLGIGGDNRNWKYSTTYTADISGFRDLASSVQDQLGDTNGPNIMNSKSWVFTTEADTTAPQVTNESPSRGSFGNNIATNLSIDIEDRKSYPGGVSGVGVDVSTCRINVSSPTFVLTTYQQGDVGVTVSVIDYGYRFIIDPAANFGQNETVSVSVYNCQDLVSNTMVTDNYTFTTSDTDSPYVDQLVPADDEVIAADATVSLHVKDDGVGVVLASTVIYVNGVYYSNGGGAGSVTTNGTRITFASSLDFNGGNYAGDTTSVSGTPADYAFIVDPEIDFVSGEAVPIAIYSRDSSNNLMERVLYSASLSGGVCTAGSSFCGINTTWNGSVCVGNSSSSGGGECGGGGGGGLPILGINTSNITVTQINEHAVLLSWHSSIKATSRVLYGTESTSSYDGPPNYGIAYSTEELVNKTLYHSVVVDGLQTGKLYYFRPVSGARGEEVIGDEVAMAPKFATYITETIVTEDKEVICPEIPPQTHSVIQSPEVNHSNQNNEFGPKEGLSIFELSQLDLGFSISGTGISSSKLYIRIF